MEIQNDKRFMHDLFTNHATEWKGVLGVVLGIFPFINEFLDLLNRGFATCAGMGGIILLVYSIDVKRMERQKLQDERDKKKTKG